jgi:hypothetical protein
MDQAQMLDNSPEWTRQADVPHASSHPAFPECDPILSGLHQPLEMPRISAKN